MIYIKLRGLKFCNPILVIIFFLIFSCDKSIRPISDSIIGEWTLVSYVVSNFQGSGKDIDDSEGQFPRPIFEFRDDGIFANSLRGFGTEYMGYRIEGIQLILEENLAYGHRNFEISIVGSNLYLKRKDIEETYTENTLITLVRKR